MSSGVTEDDIRKASGLEESTRHVGQGTITQPDGPRARVIVFAAQAGRGYQCAARPGFHFPWSYWCQRFLAHCWTAWSTASYQC